VPVYLIDPADVNAGVSGVHHIQKGASAGMKELYELLMKP
jgi:NAD-dependent deacetylase